jgi:hypothetical protein
MSRSTAMRCVQYQICFVCCNLLHMYSPYTLPRPLRCSPSVHWLPLAVLYTPPGILSDSDWTPSGVRSDSLDSPKTEAISTKKQKKSTQSPSSVQAQTSSNCSCLGEILIKILIKTTYIIKVKHYQYKVIRYRMYNRANMAQRAWGAVPVGCC